MEATKEQALQGATEALIWVTGHADFGDGGKYREGWLKVGKPALDKCLAFVTPGGDEEAPAQTKGEWQGEPCSSCGWVSCERVGGTEPCEAPAQEETDGSGKIHG